MKDTVKEGIKGFSGKLSFGWFIVPALAVAPNKNGGTASAGTQLRRNGVRRYKEQRPPATQVIPN